MIEQYPLSERKLIYRILHSQLMNFPGLIEGNFLDDLQRNLQAEATKDGVDLSDHGSWDAWLGNEIVGCDVRMAKRRTLGPDQN